MDRTIGICKTAVAVFVSIVLVLGMCPAYAHADDASGTATTDAASIAPSLSQSTVYLDKNNSRSAEVQVLNMPAGYGIVISGGDSKIAYVDRSGNDGLEVYAGWKAGTATFTITIQGEDAQEELKTYELPLTVIVLDLNFACPKKLGSGITMYKGESTVLTLTGNPPELAVKYSSSNKKVATVGSNGKLKAKGFGLTTIVATIGSSTTSIDVNVGTKKAVKAVRWAASKTPTKYSQPLRMKKGYFDCSSLTGRSYATQGIYLGGGKGWAPTAAMQAAWCARTKRVVCEKKIDPEIMRPGDLIFYRTGYAGVNQEYKHIDHVAIYVGNGQKVEVRDGIVRMSGYDSSTVVMVGRPTQKCYPVVAANGIKAQKTSPTSVNVSWNKKKGVSGYQVYRMEADGSYYTKIASVKSSKKSFVDQKAQTGQSYYYKVRCYKKIGGTTYYGPFSKIKYVRM